MYPTNMHEKEKNDLIFTCDVPVGLKFLHPLNRLLIGRPKNDPVVQISYNKILALNPSCHNYPRLLVPIFFRQMFKLVNFFKLPEDSTACFVQSLP